MKAAKQSILGITAASGVVQLEASSLSAFASLFPILASISALLLSGAVLWLSYAVAFRLFPGAPAFVRLCGTWVLSYWMMLTSFALFGNLSLFNLPVVLAALLTGCLVLARWIPIGELRRQLHADSIRMGSRLRELLVGWHLWIFVAVAFVLVLRLLRGLVAPPLGWDALTYHLFKAGRWVQTGSFVSEVGPDALRAYAYMPPGGDVVWAWAMLPFHSDTALAPAGLLVWLSLVSACFGLGRTLGGDTRASFATALALGATPSVMAFLTSAYVDNISIALVILGAVFLARAMQKLTVPDSAVAIAAFSCALCVKISAAPMLLIATLAILSSAFGVSRSWGFRVRLCAACLAMGASFAPFYAITWIETGSPVFPWDLVVAGQTVFEGLELVRTTAAGALTPAADSSITRLLWLLFAGTAVPGWPFMNLGVGMLGLLALSAVGTFIALRERRSRWMTALLLLFVAAVLGSFLSPGMVAMRTHWAPTVGRLLLPGLAPLVALGALVSGAVPRWIRILAVAAAVVQSIPRGWGEADQHHVMLAAVAVLSALLLAGLVFRISRRFGLRTAVALAGVAVLIGSIPIDRIRHAARYDIYEDAARHFGRVYDPHPLGPWRDAWPIWMELDDDEAHRIAVVAGFSKLGDNWFRYPLLGSRLQNDVSYVTSTLDGTIPDYRVAPEQGQRLDLESWLRRLVDAEIDTVVSLHPPSPELLWMVRNPQIFSRIRNGKNGRGKAFQLDREAANARLRRPVGPPQ